MRTPRQTDPEWQERTHKIRAAARKGRTAADIAAAVQLPVAAVARVLAPAAHPRLSDPAALILTGHVGAGKAPAEVQLYWVGFLTAAGRISGHGTTLTLIVTLGAGGRDPLDALQTDLIVGHTRCEFCESSLVGWQAYLRDQPLCQALIPWGVPSDLYGEDPAVLEDVPAGLVGSFICGYVDGGGLSHPPKSRRNGSFTLRGTPAVLAVINAIIKRHWHVSGGVVTRGNNGAELRFGTATASRTIRGKLDAVDSRL